MVYPIDRIQNTPSNYPINPAVGARSIPQFPTTDSLRLTQSSQGFSLSSIWNAILNCFKSFLSLFSRSSSSTLLTQNRDRIAEIAARDHFVWFYKAQENPLTAFLGNFHPSPIHLWGMQFQCAEAAFQAAKFRPDHNLMQRFQNLDGEAAFRLGRQLSSGWTIAQNNQWRQNNLRVMREVIFEKFSQNIDLKDLLLATGNAYLVEHIPVRNRDAFWGDNFDGTGQNWLGRIAMEVRGNLGGSPSSPRNSQYDQFIRHL